ncbi:hypothetical protein DMN91_002720 [Ooceraea biroi]|uniref:Uncharacterized protein n=1 Tax=Ooceraea biroi TaxID=2015173 RepID=A0A3L8DW21_OOCBI|nr:hypothetical protein DMN91_002720 [Ooceraea biroi]
MCARSSAMEFFNVNDVGGGCVNSVISRRECRTCFAILVEIWICGRRFPSESGLAADRICGITTCRKHEPAGPWVLVTDAEIHIGPLRFDMLLVAVTRHRCNNCTYYRTHYGCSLRLKKTTSRDGKIISSSDVSRLLQSTLYIDCLCAGMLCVPFFTRTILASHSSVITARCSTILLRSTSVAVYSF